MAMLFKNPFAFFKQHDGPHKEQAMAAGSVNIMSTAACALHAVGRRTAG